MKGFHAGGSKPRSMGPDFMAGGLACRTAGDKAEAGRQRSWSKRGQWCPQVTITEEEGAVQGLNAL